MRELDELLINVLQEVKTRVAFGPIDAKHPKTVRKYLKPVHGPGLKTKKDAYGVISVKVQDILEKLHRKNGALKRIRTEKAKGPAWAARKASRQSNTMNFRHNFGPK